VGLCLGPSDGDMTGGRFLMCEAPLHTVEFAGFVRSDFRTLHRNCTSQGSKVNDVKQVDF
jgi:hypothetical protein